MKKIYVLLSTLMLTLALVFSVASASAKHTTSYYYGSHPILVLSDLDEDPPFICGTSKLIDIDKNEYKTVQIGKQCWMQEDLRTKTMPDGTPLKFSEEGTYPNSFNVGNYWYFEVKDEIVGHNVLYPWSTASNVSSNSDQNKVIQGICPDGWHLPSGAEFQQMFKVVDPSFPNITYGTNGDVNSSNKMAIKLSLPQGTGEGYGHWLHYAGPGYVKPNDHTRAGGNDYANVVNSPGYNFPDYKDDDFNASNFSAKPKGYKNRKSPYKYMFNGALNLWTSISTGVSGNAEVIKICMNKTGITNMRASDVAKDFYSVRCVMNEPPTVAEVTTNEASNMANYDQLGANLTGTIVSEGHCKVLEIGFYFGKDADPINNGEKIVSTSTTNISYTVENLDYATTYYYVAYVTNEAGTAYGEVLSFTTREMGTLATLESGEVNASAVSAEVAANLASNGGEKITAMGFVYGKTTEPTVENNIVLTVANIQSGNFTATLPGLLANTTYYVRPYATNIVGTAYGETVEFKTAELAAAEVQTVSVTDPTINSAKANGKLIAQGGDKNLEAGFVYSYAVKEPTIKNSKNVAATLNGETFSADINDLYASSTYYVRAYATNAAGTTYGEVMTINTEAGFDCGGTVADYDGNKYKTVKIGNQCWMQENMRAKHYADGTELVPWSTSIMSTAAKMWYAEVTNDLIGTQVFYKWGSATRMTAPNTDQKKVLQGICPDGWHVPSWVEFATLFEYIDPEWTRCTSSCSRTSGNYQTTGNSKNQLAIKLASREGHWAAYNGPGIGSEITVDDTSKYLPSPGYAFTHDPDGGQWAWNESGFSAIPVGYINKNASSGTAESNWWMNGTLNLLTSISYSATQYPNIVKIACYNSGAPLYTHSSGENKSGYSVRCILNEQHIIPTVETGAVTPSATSAEVLGTLVSDGGEEITAIGFVYSTTADPTIENGTVVNVTEFKVGEFNAMLAELTAGTTYYVRAFATNATGTAYGEVVTFKTNVVLPEVKTEALSDATMSSVKANGTLTNPGQPVATEAGFAYSDNVKEPTIADNVVKANAINNNAFSAFIAGLKSSTTYYVRAYAKYDGGIVYGEVVTHKTGAGTIDCGEKLVDIEGNEYNTVQIGKQCWMAEDMRTKTMPNGKAITLNPEGKYPSNYNAGSGYYWYFEVIDEISGHNVLYPWSTAAGVNSNTGTAQIQGICPNGWHLPSATEYQTMFNVVDPKITVGQNVKNNTAVTSSNKLGVKLALPQGTGEGYGHWLHYKGPGYVGPNDGTPTSQGGGGTDYAHVANTPGYLFPNYEDDDFNASGFCAKPKGYLNRKSPYKYMFNGTLNLWTSYGSSATGYGLCLKIAMNQTGYLPCYYSDGAKDFYSVRCVMNEPSKLAEVKTNTANTSSYDQLGANLTGQIVSNGNCTLLESGFVVSTDADPIHNGQRYICTNVNSVSYVIENLDYATTYYYAAFVTNEVGTAFGEVLSFTTREMGTLPTVESGKVTAYAVSADANATLVANGGENITAMGFVYGETMNPNVDNGTTVNVSNFNIGNFNASISDLNATTNYYVRPFATNAVGTAYGEVVPFKTVALTLPAVQTVSLTDTTNNSVHANGNLKVQGGDKNLELGFVYSNKVQEPTTDNDKVIAALNADNTFGANLIGLYTNATYYVRAYATNAAGTTYGEVLTFTTLKAFACGSPLTDVEGNQYRTVKIGKQCWMQENLRVNSKPDGTKLTTGFRNYTDTKYGLGDNTYYNWTTATQQSGIQQSDYNAQVQGICPDGWHIPSYGDFHELCAYVDPAFKPVTVPTSTGGQTITSANKLCIKLDQANPNWSLASGTPATGTPAWGTANNDPDFNKSGFSAIPFGYAQNTTGTISIGPGNQAGFITANSAGTSVSSGRTFGLKPAQTGIMHENTAGHGWSVRCIMDPVNYACQTPEKFAAEIIEGGAELTWEGVSEESAWTVQYKEANAAEWSAPVAVTDPQHILNGLKANTTYIARVQANCSETEASEWAEVSFTTPLYDDITVDEIRVYDDCDLDNSIVSFTVSNKAGLNTITTIEAQYSINGKAAVKETISTSIAKGETKVVSFATPANFDLTSNNVITIIAKSGEATSELTLSGIDEVVPFIYPYAAMPTAESTVNVDGWKSYDLNNDNTTWTIEKGVMTYNNAVAANDWLITPCYEMAQTTKTYRITYDYAAATPANLNVYYGQGSTVADMTTLINKVNVTNTAYQTATEYITIAGNGVYNFGIFTDGTNVQVKNFTVEPVIKVNASVIGNGTIAPAGDMYIPINASQKFVLTHAEGSYLASVTDNGKEVMGTDYTYADNVDYTLEVGTIDHDIVATFGKCFGIHYTIEGTGNAIVNNDEHNNPDEFTKWIIPGTDFLSTFEGIPGYHIVSVTINGVEYGNITDWSFINVTSNQDVVIVLAPNEYTITTNAYGFGKVSEGETFEYTPDHTYTFIATPDKGYHIASIVRNGEELTIDNPEDTYTETLINILSDYDYVVAFEANHYSITATSSANGLVTPDGVTYYNYNTDATYTITPNKGCYTTDVLVDGESVGVVASYTFEGITKNHTIEAKFAKYQYTIEVEAGANGTITPGTSTYLYGDTPTFEITPNKGYGIVDVTIDGKSIGAVESYTFPELTAEHIIAATFAKFEFTITANASNGGTITPAGVTNMVYGGNQTYSIKANKHYTLTDVYVDGISMGNIGNYTFSNVTANHTIYAAFVPEEYTITVTQPANGSINPGTTTVTYGETPTFTVAAERGYEVKDILVDGTSVLAAAANTNGIYNYTFPAVEKSMTLTAKTAAKQFTITASAGDNGTITPAGTSTVAFGGNLAYTMKPAEGYEIDNVTIDGIKMGAISSYTFVNVTYNHTINVTFRLQFCEAPSGLHTSNVDTTSATLNWYHPSATSFDIQYKAADEQTFSTATTSAMSYDLTNLKPNTVYVWNVRANCVANNPSEWSISNSFKTNAVPAPIDTTGVEDYVKSMVNVYSNTNNIYVINENNVQINNIQVYDIYGRLIYNGKSNSTREVISMDVATGNYIVRLFTESGIANYKLYLSK